MRKPFLDANILVSVVNKEYPLFTSTSKILSLTERTGFQLFASTLSLGITYYFSEKKSGAKTANEKMKLLISQLSITNCGVLEAQAAAENIQSKDFEDAMQYSSAINSGCDCIVTDNGQDFYYSSLPVYSPDEYLRKLAAELFG